MAYFGIPKEIHKHKIVNTNIKIIIVHIVMALHSIIDHLIYNKREILYQNYVTVVSVV